VVWVSSASWLYQKETKPLTVSWLMTADCGWCRRLRPPQVAHAAAADLEAGGFRGPGIPDVDVVVVFGRVIAGAEVDLQAAASCRLVRLPSSSLMP
jgi:hypothetical protein